jgi:hypothetical protein
MYSLLGRKSKLSTSNKFLTYKTILKPIWTYGIELWDSGRTLVRAEYGYPNGISKHQQLKKKSAATALNTLLASAHAQTAQ